jgi:hypothetical protein
MEERMICFLNKPEKNKVSWGVTPSGTSKNRRFGGTDLLGGDTFLRDVGSYKSHTAPHPRRWHSS